MKTKEKNINGLFTAGFLVIALSLLPWMAVLAQDFTKTYQGKYDVDKGAGLTIQNKFGEIKCQAWDDSSVSINVTVKVDAPNQEKANKVFEKIGVELTGNRNQVEGITTVGNISNANYSIDYDIRMPRWININLDNQFGDIYIDEVDGTARIDLQYGAMEVEALNGPKTDLTIKFSDVTAGFMKDGSLSLEYSEWKSKGTENLKLTSRFSELTIDKVANLNLDSQYDEIRIGSAGQVISVSRFSGLDISKINGDFDFDIEYGNLDVNYISPSFKTGKVRNSFAEVDLAFDPKVSTSVNAELEFGELSYPGSNVSMNEKTVGYTTHQYNGRIGSAVNPASVLTINSKNADVDIDFEE